MPQPWKQYAAKSQPVQQGEGPWSQYGQPSVTPTQPEQPTLLQKMKTNFDAGTQHAAPPTSVWNMLSPTRALQNFGASAGDAIRGTYHMLDEKPKQTLDQQYDQAGQQVHAFAQDPVAAYVNAAGQAAPAALAGGLVHGAVDALPSTSRAAAKLNSIETQAANTPVNFSNTQPALQKFGQHVATGGKGADVMSKLGRRIENVPPPAQPTPAPMTNPTRLLGAGTEDTPLHSAPDVAGTPSKPVTLFAPSRSGPLGLPSPTGSTPMAPGLGDIFPERLASGTSSMPLARSLEGPATGMGQGEYIGEIPGERGGPGQLQGVLRRPRTFTEAPPQATPENPYSNPVNFPEARDFYTNVSDVTRKPGMLRRAFEDAREPRLRYAAGPVREGLNSDLTEALKPLNLDQDYNAALKEYARGKALKTGLKRAAIAGAGAAAGSAGLGKVHGIASSVLR